MCHASVEHTKLRLYISRQKLDTADPSWIGFTIPLKWMRVVAMEILNIFENEISQQEMVQVHQTFTHLSIYPSIYLYIYIYIKGSIEL